MKRLFLIFVLIFNIHALANEEPKNWIFGGADLGFSMLQSSLKTESNKTGYHLGLKAFYSRLMENWIIDAGGGWFYNSMSGDLNSLRTKVKTNALFAELNFQYRLSPTFSMGPAVEALFGSDTSFSSTVGGSQASVFAGLHAALRIPLEEKNDLRITAKALTDLSIKDRQVYLFLLGLQFGFSLSGSEKVEDKDKTTYGTESTFLPPVEPEVVEEPKADPTPVLPPPPTTTEPTTMPMPHYNEEIPDVKVDLGVSRVWFEFNSTRLESHAKKSLKEMGQFLASNPEDWGRIKIDGHTDQRGKDEYNLNLSRGRAESVRNALVEGGVSPEKMEVRAFGKSRPLDPQNNEAAWAKNRRVELQFFEVSNPKKVRSKLVEIIDQKNKSR